MGVASSDWLSADVQGMIRRKIISHGEDGVWVLVFPDGSVLGELIIASGPGVRLEGALSNFARVCSVCEHCIRS